QDIHSKLRSVHSGLGGQNTTLTDIERVTGQQVGLSSQLNHLSIFLKGKMNVINSSTDSQIDKVGQLQAITLDTKEKMKSVLDENKKPEQKLESAAKKSRQAERSLP